MKRPARRRRTPSRKRSSKLRAVAARSRLCAIDLPSQQDARRDRRKDNEVRQHEVAAELLSKYRDQRQSAPGRGSNRSQARSSAQRPTAATPTSNSPTTTGSMIVDRGEDHELARFSGGEQDLANLCLRLAIADWVSKERTSTSASSSSTRFSAAKTRTPPAAPHRTARAEHALPPNARHHPRRGDRRPVRLAGRGVTPGTRPKPCDRRLTGDGPTEAAGSGSVPRPIG